MLEFKKSVLKLNVYGTDVELRFPNVSEVEEFSKVKEPAITDIVNFLTVLGMPKDLGMKMEVGHLTQVTTALSEQGKS